MKTNVTTTETHVRIACSACGAGLHIVGHYGYLTHTHCYGCGADSADNEPLLKSALKEYNVRQDLLKKCG